MKKKRFSLWASVAMIVSTIALMAVALINIPRTVNNLEIALEHNKQTDTMVTRSNEDVVAFNLNDDVDYVAPLGESTVSGASSDDVMETAANAQWKIFGIFAVCLTIVISLVAKYWLDVRNQER